MERLVEWVLATLGAAISVGISTFFWLQQSATLARGEILWPLPGAVLLEIAILGVSGMAAVALDREGRSPHWGLVTWGVIGSLTTLVIVGIFSVGPFLFPAVVAFSIAAVLADRRRGRSVKSHLAIAGAALVVNGFLLFLLIALSWGGRG